MASNYPPVALPEGPYARAMQSFCLSLPEAYEDYPWGDIVYKVGLKMFAAIGGEPLGVTLKVSPEDAEVLTQAPQIERARYVGRYGWIRMRIEDDEALELAKELVGGSYELVRAKSRRRRRP